MKKQRTEYDSPVDALVAITRRLSTFEERYKATSEEFYDKFSKGQLEDSADYVDWANDYQHYMTIRLEIQRNLSHVA